MWNFEKLIEETERRIFTPDLCRELFDDDNLIDYDDCYSYDINDYNAAKKALSELFTTEQLELLNEIENESDPFSLYCIKISFKRGIYAGFNNIFLASPMFEPFEALVQDELISMPNMQKHTKYYEWHMKIYNMFSRLEETVQLESETHKYLTDIGGVLENRIYVALRYGFYWGYSYALSVFDSVKPGKDYPAAVVAEILSEKELSSRYGEEKKALLIRTLIESYKSKI